MNLQEQLSRKLAGTVKTVGREVLWLEETDSTNLVCRRMAAEGAAEGLAVLARRQTAGRGRRGRNFQSTRDLGLYLSVLLRPCQGMEEVSNMTAWVAVAVCDGIQAACGVRPQIKWINDIILNNKKLGGILTEAGLEQGRLDHIVVGIGINVHHTLEDFDPELLDMATSLALELPQPPDMVELAAHIIRALDEMYAAFPQGKRAYLAKYRTGCVTTEKWVQLITPASREEAFSMGVDDEFRLVVRMESGEERALSAGEVSVRGMYGYL